MHVFSEMASLSSSCNSFISILEKKNIYFYLIHPPVALNMGLLEASGFNPHGSHKEDVRGSWTPENRD